MAKKCVYIYHFSESIGGDSSRGKARHYVGFSKNLDRRQKEHKNGNSCGSPLIKAAAEAGVKITLAKVFPGAGRDKERAIKRQKNTARVCPICKEERRESNGRN